MMRRWLSCWSLKRRSTFWNRQRKPRRRRMAGIVRTTPAKPRLLCPADPAVVGLQHSPSSIRCLCGRRQHGPSGSPSCDASTRSDRGCQLDCDAGLVCFCGLARGRHGASVVSARYSRFIECAAAECSSLAQLGPHASSSSSVQSLSHWRGNRRPDLFQERSQTGLPMLVSLFRTRMRRSALLRTTGGHGRGFRSCEGQSDCSATLSTAPALCAPTSSASSCAQAGAGSKWCSCWCWINGQPRHAAATRSQPMREAPEPARVGRARRRSAAIAASSLWH